MEYEQTVQFFHCQYGNEDEGRTNQCVFCILLSFWSIQSMVNGAMCGFLVLGAGTKDQQYHRTLRPLYPKRWTVGHSTIDSILKNYQALTSSLQIIQQGYDEYAAKGKGLLMQMDSFDTFFSLHTWSSLQLNRRLPLIFRQKTQPLLKESEVLFFWDHIIHHCELKQPSLLCTATFWNSSNGLTDEPTLLHGGYPEELMKERCHTATFLVKIGIVKPTSKLLTMHVGK